MKIKNSRKLKTYSDLKIIRGKLDENKDVIDCIFSNLISRSVCILIRLHFYLNRKGITISL